MNNVLIRAAQVDKEFKDGDKWSVTVLQHIDCEVVPSDRIAVVGRSGSGKTTLLHLLGGLDKPTHGSVEWPGLGDAVDLRPRQIGFVFQSPSLFPALTVEQNVSLPFVLSGAKPLARDVALNLLEAFDLSGLADKFPEELSGGQAQRVAFVRAFAIQPKVILADEPTGQLDNKTAGMFFDTVLERLASTSVALVVATHDEALATRMRTRWTMDHGRLTRGEPQQ